MGMLAPSFLLVYGGSCGKVEKDLSIETPEIPVSGAPYRKPLCWQKSSPLSLPLSSRWVKLPDSQHFVFLPTNGLPSCLSSLPKERTSSVLRLEVCSSGVWCLRFLPGASTGLKGSGWRTMEITSCKQYREAFGNNWLEIQITGVWRTDPTCGPCSG